MNRASLDIETIPSACATPGHGVTELSDEDAKKAALDALTGQVVCIGLLGVDASNKVESGLALVSQNENKLLSEFWAHLAITRISRFIAHNGLGFDLPYLWRRSVVQGVRTTLNLDLRRFRSDFVFDTMAVWANWDARSYPSLDDLCRGLGVGAKVGSGAQVLELWKSGKLEDIARYCLHDCWLTYACFAKMSFSSVTPERDFPVEIKIL
jgi:3'-5' exonuclease